MGEKILSGILNGTDPAATVAQVVIKPMALTILQTVIFFVILTLAGMVVRAITRVGLGVNHIPLVGGLNRLAGLACGTVYALLLGYVIASALLLLAGLGQNQWDWLNSGILRDTVLIRGLLSLRTWLP